MSDPIIDAVLAKIEADYAEIAADKVARDLFIEPIRISLALKIKEMELYRLTYLQSTGEVIVKSGDLVLYKGEHTVALRSGDVVSIFGFAWGNDIYALPSVVLEKDGVHYKKPLTDIIPADEASARVHQIKGEIAALRDELEDIGTDTQRMSRRDLITDLGDI